MDKQMEIEIGKTYPHSGGQAKVLRIYKDDGMDMVDYQFTNEFVTTPETQTLNGFLYTIKNMAIGGKIDDVTFFDIQFALSHLVAREKLTEQQLDSILNKVSGNRIKISELKKLDGITPDILDKIVQIAKTGEFPSESSMANRHTIEDILLKDEGDFYYIYGKTEKGKKWMNDNGYSEGNAISSEQRAHIRSTSGIEVEEFSKGGKTLKSRKLGNVRNRISEDDFYTKYKPQTNHIVRKITPKSVANEDIASFGGTMYETYGPEKKYIINMSNDPKKKKKVWTIIEGDDGEMHIIAGYHYVNRQGYLVTAKEWKTGQEEVENDMEKGGKMGKRKMPVYHETKGDKLVSLKEDGKQKIGINWESDFIQDDKDVIESDIKYHVADMVKKGNTSGDLSGNLGKGEPAPYSGSWQVEIEKDENDEEIRNEAVAESIVNGNIYGYYPTFKFSANVWSEMAKGGNMKSPSNKALFKIIVPNANEHLLSDDSEYEFTSFIASKLTKKWFGHGPFNVRLDKKTGPRSAIFLITVPRGKEDLLSDESEYDFTSFIGHELTKKWHGNGAFNVSLQKKLESGEKLEKDESDSEYLSYIKNITKNKWLANETDGKIVLTSDKNNALQFFDEENAESTLEMLNENQKDAYVLIVDLSNKMSKGGEVEWKDESTKFIIGKKEITGNILSLTDPELYGRTSRRNNNTVEKVISDFEYAGFTDAKIISDEEFEKLNKHLPYWSNKYGYTRPDGISISETNYGGWRIAKHLPHKTLIAIYSNKHHILESALEDFEKKYAEELEAYEKGDKTPVGLMERGGNLDDAIDSLKPGDRVTISKHGDKSVIAERSIDGNKLSFVRYTPNGFEVIREVSFNERKELGGILIAGLLGAAIGGAAGYGYRDNITTAKEEAQKRAIKSKKETLDALNRRLEKAKAFKEGLKGSAIRQIQRLEGGGSMEAGRKLGTKIRFTEWDYKQLIEDRGNDYPFYSVNNGDYWSIKSENNDIEVGRFYKDKEELSVEGVDLIEWLKNKSYKLSSGGSIATRTDMQMQKYWDSLTVGEKHKFFADHKDELKHISMYLWVNRKYKDLPTDLQGVIKKKSSVGSMAAGGKMSYAEGGLIGNKIIFNQKIDGGLFSRDENIETIGEVMDKVTHKGEPAYIVKADDTGELFVLTLDHFFEASSKENGIIVTNGIAEKRGANEEQKEEVITEKEKEVLSEAKGIWEGKKIQALEELKNSNISEEDKEKYGRLLEEADQHLSSFANGSMEKGGKIKKGDKVYNPAILDQIVDSPNKIGIVTKVENIYQPGTKKFMGEFADVKFRDYSEGFKTSTLDKVKMENGGEPEDWDSGISVWLEKNKKLVKIKNAGDQHDLTREIAVALNKDPKDIGKIYNWLSGYYSTPFMYDNENNKYYVNKKYMKQGGKTNEAGKISPTKKKLLEDIKTLQDAFDNSLLDDETKDKIPAKIEAKRNKITELDEEERIRNEKETHEKALRDQELHKEKIQREAVEREKKLRSQSLKNKNIYIDIDKQLKEKMRNAIHSEGINYESKTEGDVFRVFLSNQHQLDIVTKLYNERREKYNMAPVSKEQVANVIKKRVGKLKFMPVKIKPNIKDKLPIDKKRSVKKVEKKRAGVKDKAEGETEE